MMDLHRRLHREKMTGDLGTTEVTPHCDVVWWVPLVMAGVSLLGQQSAANQAEKGREAAAAALEPAIQAAKQGQRFASAAADPTDPFHRNLQLILEAKMRTDALRGMREALKLDRRITRRSNRAGVFLNPERRDEARSRSILEAFQDIGNRSREETVNRLLQASAGVTGAARAVTNPLAAQSNIALQGAQADANTTAGQFQTIGTLFENPDFTNQIGNIFSGNQAATSDATNEALLSAFIADPSIGGAF